MSILANVQTSSPNVGIRMVILAAEKQGKTTLAAGAPDALLIPFEQGYAGVKLPHTPMMTEYGQFMQLMAEITAAAQAGQFKFKTLVMDSSTALETLIHRYTIASDKAMVNNKAASMEVAHGGYGKAYGVANLIFKDVLAWADMLAIHAKINIIFTAHAFAAKVKDPENGEYDSWDVLLHSPKDQKTYGKREIITQWADIVGYLHEPMVITKTDGVNKGTSMGQGRALAIERTPSYTAGNRFGMKGKIGIASPPANGWNNFAHALHTASGIDMFNRAFV